MALWGTIRSSFLIIGSFFNCLLNRFSSPGRKNVNPIKLFLFPRREEECVFQSRLKALKKMLILITPGEEAQSASQGGNDPSDQFYGGFLPSLSFCDVLILEACTDTLVLIVWMHTINHLLRRCTTRSWLGASDWRACGAAAATTPWRGWVRCRRSRTTWTAASGPQTPSPRDSSGKPSTSSTNSSSAPCSTTARRIKVGCGHAFGVDWFCAQPVWALLGWLLGSSNRGTLY